jgi:hypothetical protein
MTLFVINLEIILNAFQLQVAASAMKVHLHVFLDKGGQTHNTLVTKSTVCQLVRKFPNL